VQQDGTYRWAEPTPLAIEDEQFVVTAVTASQPQEAVRQNTAFEDGIDRTCDVHCSRRAAGRPGSTLGSALVLGDIAGVIQRARDRRRSR
jgi:hypothetical protein